MSSPALNRKRTRSQLLDEDELSPEKGSITTPLASVKKRRLNAHGYSPAVGITGSLKRTIGGIFGWGKKEKENLGVEEEEEDELASGESLDQEKNKRGAPRRIAMDWKAQSLKRITRGRGGVVPKSRSPHPPLTRPNPPVRNGVQSRNSPPEQTK